ncbi:FkbM family methyltransferase [Roseomonas sp. JC162]|uniref:FkbM family methyltransferase n=1 Tax=Neoroseomonas marina TaxID=1232220 RepID=A0A848EID4_9PROT|nr:FkbM family methyltransferase [Neoroseomonas marina]NMJ43195.1 FkbM family methyltransferase [Neoroseomonas marina]
MSQDITTALGHLATRMEALRTATLFQALGPDRILEFAAYDTPVSMYLPSAVTDLIQRSILTSGTFFEAHMLSEIRRLLPPRPVVIDAGANIGNHTLFFGLICGASEIVAFEPLRTVFPILKRNVELNNLHQVRCINAALGAREGRAALTHFMHGNLGASAFDLGKDAGYDVTTIDALDLQRCDLLKIDVEGSHVAVLEGARATLQRLRPLVWIELRAGRGEVETGDAALQALGYVRQRALGPTDFLYVAAPGGAG